MWRWLSASSIVSFGVSCSSVWVRLMLLALPPVRVIIRSVSPRRLRLSALGSISTNLSPAFPYGSHLLVIKFAPQALPACLVYTILYIQYFVKHFLAFFITFFDDLQSPVFIRLCGVWAILFLYAFLPMFTPSPYFFYIMRII